MPPYRYPTTISPTQIDVLGHLNNAAYLAIFEAARWDVLRETGVAWDTLVSLGVSPVILEINLKFRREVRDGESLIVESTFSRTGPRRFIARQKMVDQAGKLRASAELVGTFFDVVNRRIVDAPAALLQALGLTEAEPPLPTIQGVGGVFLYSADAEALAAWYASRFGLAFQNWGESRGVELPSLDVQPSGRTATTTFALFQSATPLPAPRTARVNLRVADLTSLIAALRAAGDDVEVGQDEGYGRFAWVMDPEANRVELWEPPRLER
ncbi:hypothetical protein LBMAG42_09250 [Deltaproteobacteria bacterium]|nr:hypothetical protein LBMAG42_09250 [Deltaproteobacteria bacterium]